MRSVAPSPARQADNATSSGAGGAGDDGAATHAKFSFHFGKSLSHTHSHTHMCLFCDVAAAQIDVKWEFIILCAEKKKMIYISDTPRCSSPLIVSKFSQPKRLRY